MRRSYRDRDYGFGQTILNLRSAIGLTQKGLAAYLGISRFAVGEWEAGNKYPTYEHLRAFIELAVQESAFPTGREVEEVRALWKTAHQKVLLDETWLATLLTAWPVGTTRAPTVQSPSNGTQVDWGDAPDVPNFYGREWELNLLTTWVVEKQCRMVSVLGLGGIGKSALSISLMRQVIEHFDVVIWRSLRDLPNCDTLLDSLLQVATPPALGEVPTSLEHRQSIVLDYMRDTRVLLVLDNLESVLEEGHGIGQMRPGYEGIGRFLRLCAETEHQSCVLLTSREKLGDLVALEGSESPVRSLRLIQLDAHSCQQLLAEKGVVGTAPEQACLIEMYAGNPLALKIVAQTIVDIFNGEIAPFLEQGEVIFGGVRELLRQQFDRLTALEQRVLIWLAILREPISLHELSALLVTPVPRVRLLEAMDALHRRSLVERGQIPGSFTLQSVVLEYVTARLIAEAADEIEAGRLSRLIEYPLELTQADEYIREIQERMIVAPVLAHLLYIDVRQTGVEQQLIALLSQLSAMPEDVQGYGPANLVTLLRLHRGNLRGLDLSHLALRSIYLQGIDLRDTSLAGSVLIDSVFNATFDTIIAIATSPTGDYWAGSSRSGEVWLWETAGHALYRTWQAHADLVWTLAFSPDGKTLVSGGWDGMIRLWDVASGGMLWSGFHSSHVNGLAFSPDGSMVATCGGRLVVLWDVKQTAPVESLENPCTVISLAWSPDGKQLVTGDDEGNIRFWDMGEARPSICTRTFAAHTKLITRLDFSPDGKRLASGSYDGAVKVWDMPGGHLHTTLNEHIEQIQCLAWSPDGQILASSGFEKRILLWEVEENRYRSALQGHPDMVIGLAFTPDGRNLLSSGGGMLRVWELENSRCLHIMKGNPISVLDIDWSPDSTQLVSAGADASVTIWDVNNRTPSHILRGHRRIVCGVSWRADGQQVASSSWDSTIRLWNPTTGEVVQSIQYADITGNLLYSVAWSPDGQRLASGNFMRGVQMFEMTAALPIWAEDQVPSWIRRVEWSPDGAQLAGGSEDGTVYVWDAVEGKLLHQLIGHHSKVTSVSWRTDGAMLASAGGGKHGELLVWDTQSGEVACCCTGHPHMVTAVAWSRDGEVLVTGDSDGKLRWWNIQRGECLLIRPAHQGTIQSLKTSPDGMMVASCGNDGAIMLWDMDSGDFLHTLRRDRPYERLNITEIRGLTEAQKATLRALGAIEDTPSLNLTNLRSY